MTHSFALGVGGDDIEDWEVGPQELPDEELWELAQECISEEDARGRAAAGREREEPAIEFPVRVWQELLQTCTSSSQSSMDPTPKGFHQQRGLFMVHYLLLSRSVMK